jgi:hypothetical protein
MIIMIALVVVGAVGGTLLVRRYPAVGRQQIFQATAALIGAIGSMARPSTGPAWYYTSATIATVMGTFLLMAWLRPRPMPPRAS